MKRTEIDLGDTVCCDLCGVDYTTSDAVGGFIFQSNAVCPECAPGFLETIKENGEENFIKSFCPTGCRFNVYVLDRRAGNNKIVIVVG